MFRAKAVAQIRTISLGVGMLVMYVSDEPRVFSSLQLTPLRDWRNWWALRVFFPSLSTLRSLTISLLHTGEWKTSVANI